MKYEVGQQVYVVREGRTPPYQGVVSAVGRKWVSIARLVSPEFVQFRIDKTTNEPERSYTGCRPRVYPDHAAYQQEVALNEAWDRFVRDVQAHRKCLVTIEAIDQARALLGLPE
jgi:hypothetical protein